MFHKKLLYSYYCMYNNIQYIYVPTYSKTIVGFRDENVHLDDLEESSSPFCGPTFINSFPSIANNYQK